MYGRNSQQIMVWINRVSLPPAHGHIKKRIGEKITLFFLSSSAPEKFVSRNRFGGPVPRPPAAHPPHSRLNVVLTYAIPPIQYYLYVDQTAPAAVESRACVRENCATRFYVLLGLNGPLTAMTDADAILALYLRQEGPVHSNIGSTVSCMVTHIARVWINRVRLPILLVVSWNTENEYFPVFVRAL